MGRWWYGSLCLSLLLACSNDEGDVTSFLPTRGDFENSSGKGPAPAAGSPGAGGKGAGAQGGGKVTGGSAGEEPGATGGAAGGPLTGGQGGASQAGTAGTSGGSAGLHGVSGQTGAAGASAGQGGTSQGAAGGVGGASSGGSAGTEAVSGAAGTLSPTAGSAGQGAGGQVPPPCPDDDCDLDGFRASEGDCCDRPEQCVGIDPALVNPGAFEVDGNGVDDDCDSGLDTSQEGSCEEGLAEGQVPAADAARALGVCRQVNDPPGSASDLAWGLLGASLLRADGSVLQDLRAATVRDQFGAMSPATAQSQRLLVLSTGIAADGSQTSPGPNGGAPVGTALAIAHSPPSEVLISKNVGPGSVADWFGASRLPMKEPNALPRSPDCGGEKNNSTAFDSVMLMLRLRVPTNARSLRLRVRLLTSEFPESVCTSYSDQFLALLDSSASGNPPDKNLLVYTDPGGALWPISTNLALTPLLSHCQLSLKGCTNVSNTASQISPEACSQGTAQLEGTGLASAQNSTCPIGAATDWLTVAGNVTPGEIATLRIALWDVGDSIYDSLALVDSLGWSTSAVDAPGTSP